MNPPVLNASKAELLCEKERRKEDNLYYVNKMESIRANLRTAGQTIGDKSQSHHLQVLNFS